MLEAERDARRHLNRLGKDRGHDRILVREDARNDAIDLRAAQCVTVEGGALDRGPGLQAIQTEGAGADVVRVPVTEIYKRLAGDWIAVECVESVGEQVARERRK